MTSRIASYAAAAVLCCSVLAPSGHAASSDGPASFKTEAGASLVQRMLPPDDGASAYRHYVKTQTDMLVGMTRVLMREIRNGDLDAAQSAYAPAHRYLKHIETIARALAPLHQRIDAHADAFEGKEADPKFSGFRRIEYGLFAKGSTAGLVEHGDRLYQDVRDFREQAARLDMTPSALVEGATRLAEDVAAHGLSGQSERWSKTDLWDVEADMEGVQQILGALSPAVRAQNKPLLANTSVQFAAINALLEKHKEGCGFKSFDKVDTADKSALKTHVAALAAELSTLRGALAMD